MSLRSRKANTADRVERLSRSAPAASAEHIAARCATTGDYVRQVWRDRSIPRQGNPGAAAGSGAALAAHACVPVAVECPEEPVRAFVRCVGFRARTDGTADRRRPCVNKTTQPDGLCRAPRCVGDDQEQLFPSAAEVEPVVRDGSRRADRWLSDLATGVFGVLGEDDEFLARMEAASVASAGQSTAALEKRVAAGLNDPAFCAHALSVVRAHAEHTPLRSLDLPVGITFRYLEADARTHADGDGVRDRAGADLVCDLDFGDGEPLSIPINVKWVTVGKQANGSEAVNRRTLLHLIQGGAVEERPVSDSHPERDLLRLYADEIEIVPADYYILEVVSDKKTGAFYGARFQGLLSTQTDAGELTVTQHTTRPDTLNYRHSQTPLADDLDLRASLLTALSRVPDNDRLGLALLTRWTQAESGRDDAAREHARALLGADDSTMNRAVDAFFAALSTEEGPAPAPQAPAPKAKTKRGAAPGQLPLSFD